MYVYVNVCSSVLVSNVNMQPNREAAVLGRLDTYIENLYEETDQQIKSAILILDLAKRPENLEELVAEGKSKLSCVCGISGRRVCSGQPQKGRDGRKGKAAEVSE